MRPIFGLALLAALLSIPASAAEDSQTFYLAQPARAGSVQLPRGIWEVSWSGASGSRVPLKIRTEDQKTVTVPARMVEGKQNKIGVITSVVHGVTTVQEIHTDNAKFILSNGNETAPSK